VGRVSGRRRGVRWERLALGSSSSPCSTSWCCEHKADIQGIKFPMQDWKIKKSKSDFNLNKKEILVNSTKFESEQVYFDYQYFSSIPQNNFLLQQ
jgi:hypothetical protein